MKGEAVLLRHLQKEGRLATDIYGQYGHLTDNARQSLAMQLFQILIPTPKIT